MQKLFTILIFLISVLFSEGCVIHRPADISQAKSEPRTTDSSNIVNLRFNRLKLGEIDSAGLKNGLWIDSSNENAVIVYHFSHGYLDGKKFLLFRKDMKNIIPGSFSVEVFHADALTDKREYVNYKLLYSISRVHRNVVSFEYLPEKSRTTITVTPNFYGHLVAWYPDSAANLKPTIEETGDVLFFDISYSFKAYPFYRHGEHKYYDNKGNLMMIREYEAGKLTRETKYPENK